MHPLDRPVWASLSTLRQHLSEGNALARRFKPEVNLFGSAADDSPAALAALAALVPAGDTVFMGQVPDIVVPPGFTLLHQGVIVQMLATRRLSDEPHGESDDDAARALRPLGEADAPDMLALAQLTEPGPFRPRTHTTGTYLGLREGGRLLAMAGERMRLPGYCEISGVCTHPDARGRGLARRLSAAMARLIEARDEQPFLHAWQTNHAAITLYESLGFRVRAHLNAAVLQRDAVPTT